MSDLPKGWTTTSLAELGEWVGGGTPSKAVRAYWENGSIPWVSPKDMKRRVVRDSEDHITLTAVQRSATHLVPAGAVLVVTRSGILRHTLPVAVAGVPVAINQDLKALIPYGTVVPAYVAWYLRLQEQQILRECSKDGTTVQSVETNRLLNFPIPLAPTTEQERVVESIEEQFVHIDAGLDLLCGADSKLQPFGDSLLALTDNCAPIVQLGSILREPLRNGHSAKASSSGSGIRTLTLTSVTEGDFTERNTKLTIANAQKVHDLWLEPDDILVERSNTPELVGTARRYTGPSDFAIFPDLMIRIRVREDALPQFIERVLQSPALRRYFKSKAQGISGSMPKISQQIVERAPIPFPSRQTQERIISGIEQQRVAAARLKSVIAQNKWRSDRLRLAVLSAAFAGQLPQRSTESVSVGVREP